MEKIKLMSNELYSFTYHDFGDFLKIKNNIIKESYHNLDETDHSQRSIDTNLHKKIVYTKLFKWINSCIDKVTKLENYDCDSLKICQSWANKSVSGKEIYIHNHANSIISGIFYLTSGENTSFAVDNIWFVGEPSYLRLHDNKYSCFSNNVEKKPCELIIFPSSLKHGVLKNSSLNDRYTIAFNTWIDGHWGYDDCFNGVTTKVL